ncbi:LysR substrate-binding domain-containing protein [Nocardia sp. NPDC049220]|uniref:LysR family transcriptional regulator n=1 Tax=Nocardia sp. NPDC049220 TaxID=3155273 RepID=UPI0033D204C7
MIDPTKLRLLIALHERGTVHAAASVLHISTSAASQQLATLAREMGTALTMPDGRRLKFTDAGSVLVDHAYRVIAQLERARSDVQAAAGGELGTITMGSFPSTISSLLIPVVDILRERHPRLRINIREIRTPDYSDGLASGELDIVVGIEADGAPSVDDPRYTRIALGSEVIDIAIPASHDLATDNPIDLAALHKQQWVGTIVGDACDQILRYACQSAGFTPRIRHRAGDWAAILAMVKADMGVALVPRTGRLPIPHGVIIAATRNPEIRRHLHAVVRRGTSTRPAVAYCLHALREGAGNLDRSQHGGQRELADFTAVCHPVSGAIREAGQPARTHPPHPRNFHA